MQNTVWKWRTQYISYDVLKHIIKILSNTRAPSAQTTQNESKLNSKFITIIETDLSKVDSFFNHKHRKLTNQYDVLTLHWQQNKNTHLVHCIIDGLNKLLIQLKELQIYAFTNAEGFRTIIKKYDETLSTNIATKYYPLFAKYTFYKYETLKTIINKIENIVSYKNNNEIKEDHISQNKAVIHELTNKIDGIGHESSQNEKISQVFIDAVRSNKYDIIQSILQYYKNNNDANTLENIINSPGYLGNTSLLAVCAVSGSLKIANLLIKHGADITLQNAYCRTALHISSQKGHIEIIKMLLNIMKDTIQSHLIRELDKDLNSALHLSCLTKQYSASELLINFDSGIVNQQNADGTTPLMIVCAAQQKSTKSNQHSALNDMLIILLNHCSNSDINKTDWKFQTALHYACKSGNAVCVDILLKHDIDPFVFDYNGQSSLHIAAENGHFNILKRICQYSYNRDSQISIFDHTDNKGRTALHICAGNEFKECAAYLISIGADATILDYNLCNAHSHALYCGHWTDQCPVQVIEEKKEFHNFVTDQAEKNGNNDVSFMNPNVSKTNINPLEKASHLETKRNASMVKFRIQCDTTSKQYLCIIGNCKQLGNWNVTQGVKMYRNRMPTAMSDCDDGFEAETKDLMASTLSLEGEIVTTWIAEIALPKGINIKYRYIVRNYSSLELIESLPTERNATINESMILDDGVFGVSVPRHSYQNQFSPLPSPIHKQVSHNRTQSNDFNFIANYFAFKASEDNLQAINITKLAKEACAPKRYVQSGWLVSDAQLQLRLGHMTTPRKRAALVVNNNFCIDRIVIRSGYINVNRHRGIYITVQLPIKAENKLKVYKFQANQRDINALCSLELEFFPRCGAAIARVFVLPSQIANNSGALTVALLSSPNGLLIGEFNFEYMLIQPFKHRHCGNILFKTFRNQNKYNSGILIGHRGTGSGKSALLPGPRRTHIKENTILAFHAAQSFGADYVEFDVQLTKDKIPIIYHDFLFPVKPFKIPINKITFAELKQYNKQITKQRKPLTSKRSMNVIANLKSGSNKIGNKLEVEMLIRALTPPPPQRMQNIKQFNSFLEDHFCCLADVFKLAPINLGFNIEIKYPLYSECVDDGIENVVDVNEYVDEILKIVFDYAFSSDRYIIFSSFHPDICIHLALKQPQFPVLFLTEGGKKPRFDVRCSSLSNAIKFAKSHRLFGVVTNVKAILEAPHLIDIVHKYGLILLTYGKENNDKKYIDLQMHYNIDGLISDHVQYVRQHLDSKQ